MNTMRLFAAVLLLAGIAQTAVAAPAQAVSYKSIDRMKFFDRSARYYTPANPAVTYRDNGVLEVTNTGPIAMPDHFEEASNSDVYRDFDIEATVFIKDGPQGAGNGISFRGDKSGGTNCYLFNITRDGRVGFYAYKNGTYTYYMSPDTKILHPAVKAGAPNKLRAEVRGNIIRLLVNDQLIKEINDNWRQSGRVGYYVSGGNTVEYRDFTVKVASREGSAIASYDTYFDQAHIAPDNKTLISLNNYHEKIQVHDLTNGSLLRTIEPGWKDNERWSFAVSRVATRDGSQYIATGGVGFLRIHSSSGALLKEITFPVDDPKTSYRMVTALAFSNKGDRLAYALWEGYGDGSFFSRKKADSKKIVLLDLANWTTREISAPVTERIAWSPDDTLIAGIFNPSDDIDIHSRHAIARVYRVSDGSELPRPSTVYGVEQLGFGAIPSHLVTSSPAAAIIEIRSLAYQDQVQDIKYRWGDTFEQPVFAISPDGRILAMGGTWKEIDKGAPVMVYNLQNGKLLGTIKQARNTTALAFSPDASLLLIRDDYKKTRLVDFAGFRATLDKDLEPLNAAVAASPNRENYSARAALYHEKGYYLEEIRDLDRLIKEDPRDGYAYNRRAFANYHLNLYKETADDYTRVIEYNGATAPLYTLRGKARYFANDRSGAENDLNLAVKMEPGSPLHLLERATFYHDWQEWDKSIADLLAVKKMNASLNKANFLLGDAYAQKRQFPEAMQYYNETIKNDPAYINAYYMRAMIKGEAKDADGIMENISQAIKLAEQEGNILPDLYVRRGQVYDHRKDTERALKDFATADRYGDANGCIHHAYIRLFKKEEYYDSVMNMLRECLVLDPDNAWGKSLVPSMEKNYALFKKYGTATGRIELSYYADQATNRGNSDTGRRYQSSSGSSHSGSYSSGYGSSYGSSSSSSGNRSSAGSSPSYYSSTSTNYANQYQEQRRREQDNANRRQIENNLWNMNNPYKRR